METFYLTEYAIPVIVGICLCVGYMIKTFSSGKKNEQIHSFDYGSAGSHIKYLAAKRVYTGCFAGWVV